MSCVGHELETIRTKPVRCTRCGEEKPPNDFSKNQRKVERNKDRKCKTCMSEKEARKAEAAAKAAANAAKKKAVCSQCGEEKPLRNSHFPKSQRRKESDDDRMCKICFSQNLAKEAAENAPARAAKQAAYLLALPAMKEAAAKRAAAWAEKRAAKRAAERAARTAAEPAADTAAAEVAAAERAAKRAAEKAAAGPERRYVPETTKTMLKHSVGFYKYSYKTLNFEKDQRELDGTYDVIFHHGYCLDGMENRTTQGTAIIKEGSPSDSPVAGTVDFNEKLWQRDGPVCFQRDFDLQFGEYKQAKDSWICEAQGELMNEDAAEVMQPDEDELAYTKTEIVAERAAFGWTEYEEPENRYDSEVNYDENQEVKFKSLEEAEALVESCGAGLAGTNAWVQKAERYVGDVVRKITSDHGGDYNTLLKLIGSYVIEPPVMFVEPGDLILTVEWSDDWREPCTSQYVLHKQVDGRS